MKAPLQPCPRHTHPAKIKERGKRASGSNDFKIKPEPGEIKDDQHASAGKGGGVREGKRDGDTDEKLRDRERTKGIRAMWIRA